MPIDSNHSGPFNIIGGILTYVSTLLRSVGFENTPFIAGKGGRGLGSPLFPSIEAIRAVSSPHTNAPAPKRSSTSKLKPLPNISLPSNPYCLAWAIAIVRRFIAIGYSALT